MITVVIRRTDEPKVIQMTQADLSRQLGGINGAEIILADTWLEGLKKVRTPFVSLVEPDCVFSANYYGSNASLINKGGKKGGGYNKLAMLSSCLGIRDYGNRIYHYELKKEEEKAGVIQVEGKPTAVSMKNWKLAPCRDKRFSGLYSAQVGFVPGAVIRMASIKDIVDDMLWNERDLVKLSTALSFYFWDTTRRIQVNPNTTYVSLAKGLDKPPLFDFTVPVKAANIFQQEYIGHV